MCDAKRDLGWETSGHELCHWRSERPSCCSAKRGVNTYGMNADQMREILGSHPDFKNEKSLVERSLMEEKMHVVYLLPKYHCELNSIEKVWAQSKWYTKAYCSYSIHPLRKSIVPVLESVPLESIRKHFQNV